MFSYALVVLEDLFGSRKELIDLDSIGKCFNFASLCEIVCIYQQALGKNIR